MHLNKYVNNLGQYRLDITHQVAFWTFKINLFLQEQIGLYNSDITEMWHLTYLYNNHSDRKLSYGKEEEKRQKQIINGLNNVDMNK